jgi:DNA ligase-1
MANHPAPLKPMLASPAIVDELRFPLLASPKLDGVRVMAQQGVLLSRSGRPIPNQFIQNRFAGLHGVDGELIVGSPIAPDVFRCTSSAVMSKKGEPEVTLYAFDCFIAPGGIRQRYARLQELCAGRQLPLVIIEQDEVKNFAGLQAKEEEYLARGYEGLMLRLPSAPYKHGRGNMSDMALLKLKRFADSEAIITDMKPLMRNHNAVQINALGFTERSIAKEGLAADELLGAFAVRDLVSGVEFEVGSGFNEAERRSFWRKGQAMLGQILRYRYFPSGGKDKPRMPVYTGLRLSLDMS